MKVTCLYQSTRVALIFAQHSSLNYLLYEMLIDDLVSVAKSLCYCATFNAILVDECHIVDLHLV